MGVGLCGDTEGTAAVVSILGDFLARLRSSADSSLVGVSSSSSFLFSEDELFGEQAEVSDADEEHLGLLADADEEATCLTGGENRLDEVAGTLLLLLTPEVDLLAGPSRLEPPILSQVLANRLSGSFLAENWKKTKQGQD